MTVLNDHCYIAGGARHSGEYHSLGVSDVTAISLIDGTRRAVAPMITPRFGGVSCLLTVPAPAAAVASADDDMKTKPSHDDNDSNVRWLVATGTTNSHHGQIDAAEWYDPRTGHWTSLPPMSTPRCFTTMVAYANKAYVFGGQSRCKPNPPLPAPPAIYCGWFNHYKLH